APESLPRHLQAIAAGLRAEAETAWRRDPYLTRDEFVRTMGWASKQPWQYWANTRQLVPHRLRHHVWPPTLGCRNTGQPLVRARDLPQIRVALARMQKAAADVATIRGVSRRTTVGRTSPRAG